MTTGSATKAWMLSGGRSEHTGCIAVSYTAADCSKHSMHSSYAAISPMHHVGRSSLNTDMHV